MYYSINEALRIRRPQGNNFIFISEFIPLQRNYRRDEVIIPAYGNLITRRLEPFIQFDQLIMNSRRGRDRILLSNRKTVQRYTLAEFEQELNTFINRLPSGIRVDIRPVNLLYQMYLKTSEISEASGYVNLYETDFVDSTSMADFLPPEAILTPIDLASYALAAHRLLAVKVDFSLIIMMHQNYLENSQFDSRSLSDLKQLSSLFRFRTLAELKTLVDRELRGINVTSEEIRSIALDDAYDGMLDRYYQQMLRLYNLRETEAKSLLLYSNVLIKEVIAGANKEYLNILLSTPSINILVPDSGSIELKYQEYNPL